MNRSKHNLAVLSAAALFAVGSGNPKQPTAPALPWEGDAALLGEVTGLGTASVVSNSVPHFLRASTGNLYWTQNYFDDVGGSRASVYRASKNGTPGSERLLYSEASPATTQISFRGITFARVARNWYGYFGACYHTEVANTCVIKRVPLAGGAAVAITTSLPSMSGLLETDGAALYWSDAVGIRRISVGGGPVTTLVSFAGVAPTESISLTSTHVYYAHGNAVRRVAKSGGVSSPVATGAGIDQVHAHQTTAGTTVYWTGANAAVRSRVVGSTTTSTLWAGAAGRIGTSIGFDGSRVLWTDCQLQVGAKYPLRGTCALRKSSSLPWWITNWVTTISSDMSYAGNLQWDASATFYHGPSGLMKYVH